MVHQANGLLSRTLLENWPDVNLNGAIYFSQTIPGLQLIDIFPKDFVPPTGSQSSFYTKLRTAKTVDQSSIIVIPHEWSLIRDNIKYLSTLNSIRKDRVIVVFNSGDASPKVTLPRCLQIRTFLHPWENGHGKILIPYQVNPRQFSLRAWNPVPKIGFMGFIPKPSPGSVFTGSIKSLKHPVASSVYLTRKITFKKLEKLGNSFDIQAVARPYFTPLNKNANLSGDLNSFQEHLNQCDYILAPRGFGNTSMRFYEALSAGRTPILINTYGGVPMIGPVFDWKDHILQADIFSNWRTLIEKDWQYLSIDDNYSERQAKNKELFQKILNFDSFMEKIFLGFTTNVG